MIQKDGKCLDCPHRNNLGVRGAGQLYVVDIKKMAACCNFQSQLKSAKKFYEIYKNKPVRID